VRIAQQSHPSTFPTSNDQQRSATVVLRAPTALLTRPVATNRNDNRRGSRKLLGCRRLPRHGPHPRVPLHDRAEVKARPPMIMAADRQAQAIGAGLAHAELILAMRMRFAICCAGFLTTSRLAWAADWSRRMSCIMCLSTASSMCLTLRPRGYARVHGSNQLDVRI
jgi:hypothetical protein